MTRYLVVWSTVVEESPSPEIAAAGVLLNMLAGQIDSSTFHVREVTEVVNSDGEHELGPVVEVEL
jgi:hypothetical protein